MKRQLGFLGVAIAQLATISFLYAEPAWTMMHSPVITLKTLPVDPYDMFRGEYAQLKYEMNDAPYQLSYQPDKPVYVTLSRNKDKHKAFIAKNGDTWQQRNEFTRDNTGASDTNTSKWQDNDWRVVNFSHEKPEASSDEVVIQGRNAASWWDYRLSGSSGLVFGIERFYMQEGKSRELENRGGQLQVEVAVNPKGKAIIKRVLDGKQVLYDGTKMFSL